MSEYQYYEFQAIDRPLTNTEMRELRAVSSRARITPTTFVNSYEWGDFKGSPAKWMDRYFDAFLYVANWGTHELMLRLPAGLLDPALARRCCRGRSAAARVSGDALILEFSSNDEDHDAWDDDGSGWMSSILPVRAELAAGDLRALYLGWLLCALEDDLDDDETEPPVPPGLGKLSGSLRAFAEFLRIDGDLIQVAAERSAPMPPAAGAGEMRQWIASLPDTARIDLLARVAAGEGARVRSELERGVRAARRTPDEPAPKLAPRTVRELLDTAEVIAAARRRAEQERAAREKEIRDRAAAEARDRHLDELATRADHAWGQIDTLIETKRPTAYDEAVQLLVDLRDLAIRNGLAHPFETRLEDLRSRHAKKTTFLKRLSQRAL